jgi:hypothetical protein
MNWLKRLFKYFGWSFTRADQMVVPPKQEKFHCIRFMTDRGEQIGILLTGEEFETGIRRWVDSIEEMPIETTNATDEESIS